MNLSFSRNLLQISRNSVISQKFYLHTCCGSEGGSLKFIQNTSEITRIARISHNDWRGLQNKIIENNAVDIIRCGNILPYMNGPIFNANVVFLRDCDKNFIGYWLDRKTFPLAKSIILDSHPCDQRVLKLFKDTDVQIYLGNRYIFYKEYWVPNQSNIITSDYSNYLSSLTLHTPTEKLKFSNTDQ